MPLAKILAPALPFLAVVGAGLAEAPVRAQDGALEVARTTVPLRGLDLTSAEDRSVLDRRIRRTVQTMCLAQSLPRTGSQFVCINRAMREAQAQRDAAIVDAMTKAATRRETNWGGAAHSPANRAGAPVPADWCGDH